MDTRRIADLTAPLGADAAARYAALERSDADTDATWDVIARCVTVVTAFTVGMATLILAPGAYALLASLMVMLGVFVGLQWVFWRLLDRQWDHDNDSRPDRAGMPPAAWVPVRDLLTPAEVASLDALGVDLDREVNVNAYTASGLAVHVAQLLGDAVTDALHPGASTCTCGRACTCD